MSLLRDEHGAALVTAMLVTILIGVTGIVGLIAVDRYQRNTGDERVREASFQLAEAAVGAAVVPLNGTWPASAGQRPPATCSSGATVAGCPDPGAVATAFAGTDAAGGAWTVEIRDDVKLPNEETKPYNRAELESIGCGAAGPCTWDANGNGRLWIRASATAGPHQRSVVSLIRRQQVRVPLPRASVIAGRFRTTNNGEKVLVDESGCSAKLDTPVPGCQSAQPGPVMVRCTPPAVPNQFDPCTGYREGQISPPITQQYSGAVLSTEALSFLRNGAMSKGTYYTTCPTEAQLNGPNVFIAVPPSVTCKYQGAHIFNSQTTPGRVFIESGIFELSGTTRFYGLIYHVNARPSPADADFVVRTSGNATVQGAIYIEGNGGLEMGSSGENLIFDERAVGDATAWSLATLEHQSFRELTPGE